MGGTFRLSGVICSQFADSDIQGAMKFLQTPGAHSHNIIELSNSPPSKKIEAVSVHGAVGSLLICVLSFVVLILFLELLLTFFSLLVSEGGLFYHKRSSLQLRCGY